MSASHPSLQALQQVRAEGVLLLLGGCQDSQRSPQDPHGVGIHGLVGGNMGEKG